MRERILKYLRSLRDSLDEQAELEYDGGDTMIDLQDLIIELEKSSETTRELRSVLDDYHTHFALNANVDNCGACKAIEIRILTGINNAL